MRLLEKLALITALLVSNVATAQTPSFDTPQTGARIRVSLTGAPANTATVLARSNDSIVVEWANGRRDSISMNDVTRLDISGGQRRHVKRGALIGLGAGTVIGVLGKVGVDKKGNDVREQACAKSAVTCLFGNLGSNAESMLSTVLIPVSMLAGAGIGALIGSNPSEQWHQSTPRRVDARVGLVPTTSTRGVALVVSGRF